MTKKSGVSKLDEFDDVKVDQMVNNNVNEAVFQKTVVCLNGRRETRKVTTITNVVVNTTTNVTVVVVTNLSVSMTTNHLVTAQTNLAPLQPTVVGSAGSSVDNGSAAVTDTAVTAATNTAPAITTNTTISIARTQGGTASPTQAALNTQLVRTLNNQITTVSNNLTIALMTNVVVTMETNRILSYVTNAAVVSVTNIVVIPTNGVAYDYFLYTELLAPSDFSLAQGESLILLVDGKRYGLFPGTSNTAFVGRRGYTSTLYRANPELLVAIANAREVRVRIRGVNSVIERTMSHASKQHFRQFLVQYFVATTTPAQEETPQKTRRANPASSRDATATGKPVSEL